MRYTIGFRIAVALALVFGVSVAGARQAAADHFTATIHAMECYTGVGSDIFEECHTEVEVATGIVETDDSTAVLSIPEDVLAAYLGAYVYCRDLIDDEVLFDGNYADTGGGAVLAVEEGDDIVCDVYLITPAPDDDGGAKDDGGTTGGGVTTLPATGAGTGSGTSSPMMMLVLAVLALAAAAAGLRLRHVAR